MRKVAAVLAIAFCFTAIFTFSNIVFAQEGEIINDVCPVMGSKVDKDTPYKIEYEGKLIGFCCPGCIDTFKADPEKYMKKLKKKCIIKCPQCGAEIDLMEKCKEMGGACPMMQ